jgi:hypothetical protein
MTVDTVIDVATNLLPLSALQKLFHAAMLAACQQLFITADPTAQELEEMRREGGYATLHTEQPRLIYPHTMYKKRIIDIAVRIQKRKSAGDEEARSAKRRLATTAQWSSDDGTESPPVESERAGKRKRDNH